MIDKILNGLTSISSIAQNTAANVSITTGLKAVGRPAFIFADRNADAETKKYAATKEFLYQALCLVIYMLLIMRLFKKGGFWLAKNKIFKNKDGFEMFKNCDEYLNFHKLADMTLAERQTPKNKKLLDTITNKDLKKTLETTDEIKENYHLCKGAIEFSSIIGSIIGLTILAPQISHFILHPIMNALGIEKHGASGAPKTNIDKKA